MKDTKMAKTPTYRTCLACIQMGLVSVKRLPPLLSYTQLIFHYIDEFL